MRDIKKYSDDYINKNDFEAIQVNYRRRRILESLKTSPIPLSILEIGCGMEPLFLFYKDYSKYVVAEPSTIFFANAENLKNNIEHKSNSKIMLYNDFFENLEHRLLDYTFDYIICSSLLHEVESPENILKSIYKVAISNKTIIHINVPNANSFHRLLAKESGLINDVHDKSEKNILFQQHTNFDIESLSSIVKQTGFEIIKSGSYFIKPFTHHQMEEMIKIGVLNTDLLDGLYNMTKYMPNMGSEIFVECRKIPTC